MDWAGRLVASRAANAIPTSNFFERLIRRVPSFPNSDPLQTNAKQRRRKFIRFLVRVQKRRCWFIAGRNLSVESFARPHKFPVGLGCPAQLCPEHFAKIVGTVLGVGGI